MLVLSKIETHIIPEINPTVWLPAKRYPVADAWGTGKVNYAEYVMNKAVNGTTKMPAQLAIIAILAVD